jgi:hypothetical protein
MADYTPVAGDALQDDMILRVFTDAIALGTYDATKATAKYTAAEWVAEIRALIAGRVSSYDYDKTWDCLSTDAVGDPVYVTGDDAVTLALATSWATSKVIGFIRWKDPDDNTLCKLHHFVRVTGLAGGAAGGLVYLADDGSLSATPGKNARILGMWTSATECILFANSLTAQMAHQNPAVRLYCYDNFR